MIESKFEYILMAEIIYRPMIKIMITSLNYYILIIEL